MTTTQQIIEAAEALGKLISSHDTASRFQDASQKLRENVEAQRLLNDFNRQVMTISQKEAEGKPIEVDDKRKLEQLQKQVIHNALLRDFQTAQMDYVDLMRKIDAAIFGQSVAGQMAEALTGRGTVAGR